MPETVEKCLLDIVRQGQKQLGVILRTMAVGLVLLAVVLTGVLGAVLGTNLHVSFWGIEIGTNKDAVTVAPDQPTPPAPALLPSSDDGGGMVMTPALPEIGAHDEQPETVGIPTGFVPASMTGYDPGEEAVPEDGAEWELWGEEDTGR